MQRANVFVNNQLAGTLSAESPNQYRFEYLPGYSGDPISLTMPVREQLYVFEKFPAFFDGLLPEGSQLEALLRQKKIDRSDFFNQLLAVGEDLVGAVTVKPILS
jgi:serine/threonine-protein kinase HipA